MFRILIGSPVCQIPSILQEFLSSLSELDVTGCAVDFAFVDDNDDPASSARLAGFVAHAGNVTILEGTGPTLSYRRDDHTHYWQPSLYERVAEYKDRIIAQARTGDYDALFLIDSDLILHPRTLQHLIAADIEICAEVFWTRWQPTASELPQVWVRDSYTLFPAAPGEVVDEAEARRRTIAFLDQLRVPGVYEVGGLGACTLIRRRALEAGVSFRTLPNVSMAGEDRHFCIRAVALGFRLFVDTHVPALHLYRSSDLARIPAYRETGTWSDTEPPAAPQPAWLADAVRKPTGNHLVLSMLVRNEADRFLRPVLSHAARYVDAAVIVDDASTDDSVAVCRELLEDLPHRVVELPESLFGRESTLRSLQWQAALEMSPDWILCLDADEVFEDAIRDHIRSLIDQTESDVIAFRLYDFWDADHYRDDGLWQAHRIYRPFLVRPLPGLPAEWPDQSLHAGRFPPSIESLKWSTSHIRLKHLGWSTPRERARKYERYRRLDPKAVNGSRQQYDSILDLRPTLRRWEE